MPRLLLIILTAVAALTLTAAADASILLARDVTNVRLEVDSKGRTLVTYRQGRTVRHVLAWGAVDAQVDMRVDYSGGFGAFGTPVWKRFRDVSRPYPGPPLQWLLLARTAPDGSFWALQAWQRGLPNQGRDPAGQPQSASELRLSHWRGELPKIEVWLDWVFRGRYQHLFGRYTYKGEPVFGFRNTPSGKPLDKYSRNVYLDVLNSAYGPGWERENSFLTHRPNGNFCYGFYPRGAAPGTGERYRITVIGPGVTPDAYWEAPALGAFDPAYEADMNALGDQVANGDPRCRQH